jgi:FkbH-like protein
VSGPPVNQYSLPDDVGGNDVRYTDFRDADTLQVIVLGGCMSQYAADALRRIGDQSGFSVNANASWPSNFAILDGQKPDLVTLQLSTTWLLGPLWDRAAFFDDRARAEMLEFIKESCAVTIRETRSKTENCLLLVHGFSRPMISPLGIHEFRYEYNFDRIIFELNEHIRSLIRSDLNIMYVDEERIFSNIGKSHLLDHMVAPFSHHGPIDLSAGPPVTPTRVETFEVRRPVEIAYLLAREYLDHYVAWKGTSSIKCIVTDLDDILWPLIVGENGFDFDKQDLAQSLRYGVWGGIHQALQILKKRGVLLATASRNSHDVVMTEWQKLAAWCKSQNLSHVLRPDDFVLHEINWGPKSESIERVLSALETTDAHVLFIDDNPVERAEVRERHTDIQILGDNINLVRSYLLTNPRLQFNKLSVEAEKRTSMVKAQLTREATRKAAPSAREFLQNLNVEIRIHRMRPGHSLHRCAELLQRTNQFNITLRRHTIDELQKMIRQPEISLFVFEVSDKFGAYGTVGLCIIQENEVTDFVMSCRVIGLRPELPFLRASLLAHKKPAYRGSIAEGPRNHPCRALFADAGFRQNTDGVWELPELSDLKPVDPRVYRIILFDNRPRNTTTVLSAPGSGSS